MAAPAPPPGYAPAPPPGYAPAPPPGYAPYPYPYYPPYYPYGPPPYPGAQPPQPPAPPPPPPEPERDVTWFVRLGLGMGPTAFSEQTDLLRLEGYGGVKLWAALDGGYLFHPNIGVGAWAAISRWSSSPYEQAPALGETAYFIGGEVPIRLGSRAVGVLLAPRIGFSSGEQSLGGDAPFQDALSIGAELSLISFKYHIEGSIGFLRASVPPPGELGRAHDLGGLYFLFGGVIDG